MRALKFYVLQIKYRSYFINDLFGIFMGYADFLIIDILVRILD